MQTRALLVSNVVYYVSLHCCLIQPADVLCFHQEAAKIQIWTESHILTSIVLHRSSRQYYLTGKSTPRAISSWDIIASGRCCVAAARKLLLFNDFLRFQEWVSTSSEIEMETCNSHKVQWQSRQPQVAFWRPFVNALWFRFIPACWRNV